MLPIEQLEKLIQGKKVAFIGAGVSHKRCIEQFVELGAQVTLCDQKKSIEDFGDYADTLRRLNVALSLGEHYTDGFAGQDIIMRTPGYEYFKPELQAAKTAGAMVTSEVELFFQFCPCEIVAVTGSDGKSFWAATSARRCCPSWPTSRLMPWPWWNCPASSLSACAAAPRWRSSPT